MVLHALPTEQAQNLLSDAFGIAKLLFKSLISNNFLLSITCAAGKQTCTRET